MFENFTRGTPLFFPFHEGDEIELLIDRDQGIVYANTVVNGELMELGQVGKSEALTDYIYYPAVSMIEEFNTIEFLTEGCEMQ